MSARTGPACTRSCGRHGWHAWKDAPAPRAARCMARPGAGSKRTGISARLCAMPCWRATRTRRRTSCRLWRPTRWARADWARSAARCADCPQRRCRRVLRCGWLRPTCICTRATSRRSRANWRNCRRSGTAWTCSNATIWRCCAAAWPCSATTPRRCWRSRRSFGPSPTPTHPPLPLPPPSWRCLAGMSYALEGRMTEAEQLLREVLQEAQGQGAARIGVASMAAGLLSDMLYECNELEAACSLLDPRIEVLERASIPDAVLRAFVVLACAHWLTGRRLQALGHLQRLEDYAARNGLDRLLAHALRLRMRLHLKQGQTMQADMVFGRIEVLGARHAGAGKGTAAETWRTTERARADMRLHWNDFGAAVDCLGALVQRTASAGRLRTLAALQLQLAVAESGRGNQQGARHQAIEALRLGHRLGLVRSLLDVSTNVPALLDALLADAVPDPVLAFYARRLLDAAAATRRMGAA